MKRPDLAAWLVVVVALVGVVVLATLHLPIPSLLDQTLTTSLGAAAGISVVGSSGLTDLVARLEQLMGATTPNPPTPASSPAPAPAPSPLTTEPATGVMRAATHAP